MASNALESLKTSAFDLVASFARIVERNEVLINEENRNLLDAMARAKTAGNISLDQLWPEVYAFTIHFPSVARESMFLSVYAFVESTLIDFCRTFIETNQTVKLEHMAGRGIAQCKTYMEKVYGLRLPVAFLSGAEFKLLNKARNAIAHNRGFVDNPERFESWRKQVSSLMNDIILDTDSSRLSLGARFLPLVLQRVREMFEDLFSQVKARAEA